MLLRIILAGLLLFVTDVSAQETAAPQTDKSEASPAEEKPKQQKTDTRTASMTSGGDSAAGSIGGNRSPESVKVSSGGAATQPIPIAVPPGTAGVQPNPSFNYNSQGENSLLGGGWSISGLPVIHRCSRTVAQMVFAAALTTMPTTASVSMAGG